jgi:hypothetical protein
MASNTRGAKRSRDEAEHDQLGGQTELNRLEEENARLASEITALAGIREAEAMMAQRLHHLVTLKERQLKALQRYAGERIDNPRDLRAENEWLQDRNDWLQTLVSTTLGDSAAAPAQQQAPEHQQDTSRTPAGQCVDRQDGTPGGGR